MRSALRLLASVSRQTTYLEPGLPTGITGLLTHKTPRSTLLYLYASTLETLRKDFPESSVYRQSTEALTKHRMSIVENAKPAGLSEWQQRVSKVVDEHPDAFRRVPVISGEKGEVNIVYFEPPPETHWKTEDEMVNSAYRARPQPEGPQEYEDVKDRGRQLERDTIAEEELRIEIEAEPPLSLEQIGEVEEKIGAGLIEEVIRVAEGEKECAERLAEYKVWEDLEEHPVEGQWVYNERKNM